MPHKAKDIDALSMEVHSILRDTGLLLVFFQKGLWTIFLSHEISRSEMSRAISS